MLRRRAHAVAPVDGVQTELSFGELAAQAAIAAGFTGRVTHDPATGRLLLAGLGSADVRVAEQLHGEDRRRAAERVVRDHLGAHRPLPDPFDRIEDTALRTRVREELAELDREPSSPLANERVGRVARWLGDESRARTHLLRAAVAHREQYDELGAPGALLHAAALFRLAGDGDAAAPLVERAVASTRPDRGTAAVRNLGLGRRCAALLLVDDLTSLADLRDAWGEVALGPRWHAVTLAAAALRGGEDGQLRTVVAQLRATDDAPDTTGTPLTDHDVADLLDAAVQPAPGTARAAARSEPVVIDVRESATAPAPGTRTRALAGAALAATRPSPASRTSPRAASLAGLSVLVLAGTPATGAATVAWDHAGQRVLARAGDGRLVVLDARGSTTTTSTAVSEEFAWDPAATGLAVLPGLGLVDATGRVCRSGPLERPDDLHLSPSGRVALRVHHDARRVTVVSHLGRVRGEVDGMAATWLDDEAFAVLHDGQVVLHQHGAAPRAVAADVPMDGSATLSRGHVVVTTPTGILVLPVAADGLVHVPTVRPRPDEAVRHVAVAGDGSGVVAVTERAVAVLHDDGRTTNLARAAVWAAWHPVRRLLAAVDGEELWVAPA